MTYAATVIPAPGWMAPVHRNTPLGDGHFRASDDTRQRRRRPRRTGRFNSRLRHANFLENPGTAFHYS